MKNDVKELRKMAGLTQWELAQKCGVSRMKLSLAECGQAELSTDDLAAVNKILREMIANRATKLHGLLSRRAVQV